MADLKRILKECFWDLKISEEDITDILNRDDFAKKKFLFEKILWNSTRLFDDLSLFKPEELRSMLDAYKIPNFNREYIARRVNMAQVYFFDKPLTVEDLQWVA